MGDVWRGSGGQGEADADTIVRPSVPRPEDRLSVGRLVLTSLIPSSKPCCTLLFFSQTMSRWPCRESGAAFSRPLVAGLDEQIAGFVLFDLQAHVGGHLGHVGTIRLPSGRTAAMPAKSFPDGGGGERFDDDGISDLVLQPSSAGLRCKKRFRKRAEPGILMSRSGQNRMLQD
jgi:hypothetical protein